MGLTSTIPAELEEKLSKRASDFRVATRTTSREINRRIALNLVREQQPISRADLARRMKMSRGVISGLQFGLRVDF